MLRKAVDLITTHPPSLDEDAQPVTGYVEAAGDDVGLELITLGHAKTDDRAHSRSAEYDRAERAARARGIGLWGRC